MKRILLLTCFVILGATAVSAQTGAVCIFSDAAGTECNILDTGALVQVYIVHSNTPGATASQFRLDVDAAAWTYVASALMAVLSLIRLLIISGVLGGRDE